MQSVSEEEWLNASRGRVERVPDEVLRPLREVSDLHAVAAILFDYAVIATVIIACETWFRWWRYPLAVIIIGARQQAMLILMHEAAHERLFRHRGVNDLVGEVLTAWPIFVSMRGFRDNHIAHHRFLNTKDDPDWIRYKNPDSELYSEWRYPRPRRTVIKLLLLDLIGWNWREQFRRGTRLSKPQDHRPERLKIEERPNPVKLSRSWKRARRFLRLSVLVVLLLTGTWPQFILYWVVPLFTSLKAMTRLRQLTGHFAIYGGEGLRTTLCGPITGFLPSPHNIGYHTEHHLYPNVAWHNLPKLHRILVERGYYAEGTCFRVSRGYLSVLTDWERDDDAQRATAVTL